MAHFINTSRADFYIPFKPVEVAGTRRYAKTVDGQLVEVEEKSSSMKVPGEFLVPGGTKLATGQSEKINKSELAKLDLDALKGVSFVQLVE